MQTPTNTFPFPETTSVPAGATNVANIRLTDDRLKDVEDWTLDFETHCELYQVPERAKNLLCALAMRGEAIKFYRVQLQLRQLKPADYHWADQLQDLVQHFQPLNQDRKINEEWNACHQTTTVTDFYTRLQSLWRKKPHYTNQDALYKFLSGLRMIIRGNVELRLLVRLRQAPNCFQVRKYFRSSQSGELGGTRPQHGAFSYRKHAAAPSSNYVS